jgi:thymidylate synthase ThyX
MTAPNYPVLRELREVLKERRHPPGQKDPVASFDEVSSRYPPGGENAVRKFERKDTAPNYNNVDAMVEAYATATGASVFDLWDEAIQRARDASSGESGGEHRRRPQR